MDINQLKSMEPLFGSWYVTGVLGEGSFGKVFEIEKRDERFGKVYKAALKVISIPQNSGEIQSLKSEGMTDKDVSDYYMGIVKEVINEYDLMARLKGNSYIVSCEDYYILDHADGMGCDILIRMELLYPLVKTLASRELTEREVIQLGIDLCHALEVCQNYNIIHRDIKPENVFISDIGTYKLGDFGIARTVEKTTSTMSKKGTYTYMAPEIYHGRSYGKNVDIYSIGLVMYRLLNKNRAPFFPPFPNQISYSDKENALVRRMSGEMLPEPEGGCVELKRVVLKASAFRAEDRYQNPENLRADLEKVLYKLDSSSMTEPSDSVDSRDETTLDFNNYPQVAAEVTPEVIHQDKSLNVDDEITTSFSYNAIQTGMQGAYAGVQAQPYMQNTRSSVQNINSQNINVENAGTQSVQYAQSAQYGQQNSYTQPVQYAQQNPYAQPVQYAQQNSYAQPVQYGQQNSYVQPAQYAQHNPYTQPGQFMQQANAVKQPMVKATAIEPMHGRYKALTIISAIVIGILGGLTGALTDIYIEKNGINYRAIQLNPFEVACLIVMVFSVIGFLKCGRYAFYEKKPKQVFRIIGIAFAGVLWLIQAIMFGLSFSYSYKFFPIRISYLIGNRDTRYIYFLWADILALLGAVIILCVVDSLHKRNTKVVKLILTIAGGGVLTFVHTILRIIRNNYWITKVEIIGMILLVLLFILGVLCEAVMKSRLQMVMKRVWLMLVFLLIEFLIAGRVLSMELLLWIVAIMGIVVAYWSNKVEIKNKV